VVLPPVRASRAIRQVERGQDRAFDLADQVISAFMSFWTLTTGGAMAPLKLLPGPPPLANGPAAPAGFARTDDSGSYRFCAPMFVSIGLPNSS
jgi:hypothetical protein